MQSRLISRYGSAHHEARPAPAGTHLLHHNRVTGGTGQDPTGGVSGGRVKTVPQADLAITAFCRDAILDAAQPEPNLDEMGHVLPAWLAAVLIFTAGQGENRGRKPHSVG